jgi:hypothetical protein
MQPLRQRAHHRLVLAAVAQENVVLELVCHTRTFRTPPSLPQPETESNPVEATANLR